jgi:hypothetical protein
LQENIKCVRNRRKQKKWRCCTLAYKNKQTPLCKSCFQKESLHDGCGWNLTFLMKLYQFEFQNIMFVMSVQCIWQYCR